MAFYSSASAAKMHRDGHTFGDRNKRTSIGNGKRKRGSYKLQGKKKYRGQGRWSIQAPIKGALLLRNHDFWWSSGTATC